MISNALTEQESQNKYFYASTGTLVNIKNIAISETYSHIVFFEAIESPCKAKRIFERNIPC